MNRDRWLQIRHQPNKDKFNKSRESMIHASYTFTFDGSDIFGNPKYATHYHGPYKKVQQAEAGTS